MRGAGVAQMFLTQNPPSQLQLPKIVYSGKKADVGGKDPAALFCSSSGREESSGAKGDMKKCLVEEQESC